MRKSLVLLSLAYASAQKGQWTPAGSSGVVCIHAAVISNNRLVCMERPHKDQYTQNALTNGLLSAEIDLMATVNADGTWTSSFTAVPVTTNPFCAGHAKMANGAFFVAGGDNQTEPSSDNTPLFVNGRMGRRIYTPCGTPLCKTPGTWTYLPDMTTNRWYPTVLTLQTGQIIIIGGNQANLDFDKLIGDGNPTYEYYPSKAPTPIKLELLQWAYPHHMYPISFVLPSGNVFLFASNKSIIINTLTDTITNLPDMPVMDHSPWIYPHTPTSFILPLTYKNNYRMVVMVCGGSKLSSKDASPMCWKIAPEDPAPTWTQSADMPQARLMPDSVLLPTGKILVVNGLGWGQAGGNAGETQYARTPIYESSIFDPQSSTFATLASATQKRLYHSGALLLQTGHVMTFGSEMDNYDDYWTNAATNKTCLPNTETACTSPFNTNLERFTPPYLQSGRDRPVIVSMASVFTHDSLVEIKFVASAGIQRITMTRASSTTHSTNTDQRFIELQIVARSLTSVFVNVMPLSVGVVGEWFVWALDAYDVPSLGQPVMISVGSKTMVTLPPDAVKSGATSFVASRYLSGILVTIAIAIAGL